MLGLYLTSPRQMELKEFPPAVISEDDQVKIRLIYGGICGSDVSVYHGTVAHATYPVCPGHELIGEVVETSSQAKIEVGKRVVVVPNSFCDQCEYCLKGKRNLCVHKRSLGVNADGVFQQELVVSCKYVLEVPENLPNEKAVLIEPMAVVVHALQKVEVKPNTKVAVVGCGTEGMLAIILTHHLGASLTAIDIKAHKLDNVRRIGNIRTALPYEVGNEKFDVVIECAGKKESVEQAVKLVKPGGSLVIVGFAPQATFPVVQIVRNELSIYGSIIYHFPDDFLQSMQYLATIDFDPKVIISKVYHFTEYEKAYRDASSGDFGKIILDFRGN